MSQNPGLFLTVWCSNRIIFFKNFTQELEEIMDKLNICILSVYQLINNFSLLLMELRPKLKLGLNDFYDLGKIGDLHH